jgi:hypothetical protein
MDLIRERVFVSWFSRARRGSPRRAEKKRVKRTTVAVGA